MNKLELLIGYVLGSFRQIGNSFYVSSVLSVFTFSLSGKILKWIELNVDYVYIALFLIAVDHCLGSIVHCWFKKDFSWQLNITGLLIRLGMVTAVGSCLEVLTYLVKDDNLIFTYLRMVCRLVVCLYPFRSVAINANIITKGKFPPKALIGKIDDFNKDLDVKHFKNKEDK